MARTARGMETRERLLDAAEAVFGEQSYFRVTIADLTRAAGVAMGTFYLYFPSKEAIFRELIQQRAHELRMHTRLATEHAADRVAAERRAFATFFNYIAHHRNLYRIVRQAEFVDLDLFRDYYRQFAAGYTTGLQVAMESGQIATLDPEVLAYCLMGVGDFVGMRWVVWHDGAIPPATFDDVMRFIEHGLRGSPTTTQEGVTKPSDSSASHAMPASTTNVQG